jgi:hypothetical protein
MTALASSIVTAKNIRVAWLVLTVIGIVAVPYLIARGPNFGYDAHAYWSLDLSDPYAGPAALSTADAFRYAPPIALLMAPFHLLDWPVFLATWTALLYLAVGWLGRWWWGFALIAFAPVAMEMHYGNINLFLAAAIAASFRWPALWSIVLLTKPTAAVGLLYPLVRRDWRAVAVPLAVTAVACIASAVVRPDLWNGYLTMLVTDAGVPQPIPLAVRLPIAAVIVAWGGLTGRRWTIVVGATIGLPQSWWTNLALLAALPRTLDRNALPRPRFQALPLRQTGIADAKPGLE